MNTELANFKHQFETKQNKTVKHQFETSEVDNSFQYFAKKASDRILLILLGDKCLRETLKSFCELFEALIALTMVEFLPYMLVL